MTDPLISLLIASLGAAFVALVFWPGSGLYARWRRGRDMSERVLTEDALKYICKCEDTETPPTVQSIAGNLGVSTNETTAVLQKLQDRKLVLHQGTCFRLTGEGRRYALNVIRAHRLWERFLADRTGFSEEEWHDMAERLEHRLSPGEVEALSQKLGSPTHDPHGDPIPTSTHDRVSHGGHPLTAAQPDTPLRIVHIEDEPAAVYAQLVAIGLRPGMAALVTEIGPRRVRLWADGAEHVLAPIVAANVSVVALPAEQEIDQAPGERLSTLGMGESAEVVRLSRVSRGPERRRLMDLGVLPGTTIRAEMKSPSGDLTGYRIREALIALRKEQADLIQIRRPEAGA